MAAREALQGNEQVVNDVKRLLQQTTGGLISAEVMQELLQGGEVRAHSFVYIEESPTMHVTIVGGFFCEEVGGRALQSSTTYCIHGVGELHQRYEVGFFLCLK